MARWWVGAWLLGIRGWQCFGVSFASGKPAGMRYLQLQSRNQTWATLVPETMSQLDTTLSLEEMI